MALYPFSKKYRVSQKFGVKNSAYRLGFHPGTDYAVPIGTPIRATVSGVVRYYAGNNGGYGNVAALITGNGDVVWHAHLSRRGKTGRVLKGQVLGYSGATGWVTGPHSHIEYRKGGSQDRPSDFQRWLAEHPEKPPKKPSKLKKYTIKAGDTLGKIARRYRVNLKLLLQKNTQYKKNPNLIYPGQKVNIPKTKKKVPVKPRIIKVRRNEGLSHVARRAGFKDWARKSRWQTISKLNGRKNWSNFNKSLKPGQKVRVRR